MDGTCSLTTNDVKRSGNTDWLNYLARSRLGRARVAPRDWLAATDRFLGGAVSVLGVPVVAKQRETFSPGTRLSVPRLGIAGPLETLQERCC